MPLKGRVEDLKDCRPIIFVNDLYKLFAKVLANRLKKAMKTIFLDLHNAFVEGEIILDIMLITNEVIDSKLLAIVKSFFNQSTRQSTSNALEIHFLNFCKFWALKNWGID